MKGEFDAGWQGQAKIVEDGWTAEFRIPWSVLGIDPSRPPTVLGWNISRDHARHVATYDWNVIIPPFTPIAASRYGHLTGFEDLKKLYADGASASGAVARPMRPEWVWIPYGIAGADRSDGTTNLSPKAGLDGSVRWAGRWRAHWTLNTDFAQVDVDDQVINLTRYPLFLPDKRTFFQDDLEIFAFGRPGEVQPRGRPVWSGPGQHDWARDPRRDDCARGGIHGTYAGPPDEEYPSGGPPFHSGYLPRG